MSSTAADYRGGAISGIPGISLMWSGAGAGVTGLGQAGAEHLGGALAGCGVQQGFAKFVLLVCADSRDTEQKKSTLVVPFGQSLPERGAAGGIRGVDIAARVVQQSLQAFGMIETGSVVQGSAAAGIFPERLDAGSRKQFSDTGCVAFAHSQGQGGEPGTGLPGIELDTRCGKQGPETAELPGIGCKVQGCVAGGIGAVDLTAGGRKEKLHGLG